MHDLDDDDDEEETRKVFEKFDVIANKIIEDSNVPQKKTNTTTTKHSEINDDHVVELAITAVNQVSPSLVRITQVY